MALKLDEYDILNCGICRRLLNKPKTLPCLHMFCRSCLIQLFSSNNNRQEKAQNLSTKFRCPICKTLIALAQDVAIDVAISTYVNKLPTNTVVDALTQRSRIRTEGATCPCQVDEHAKKAIAWCDDCREALCNQCNTFHSNSKILKSHKVIEIKDMNITSTPLSVPEYCKEHSEILDTVYLDHQQPCCVSCISHRKCNHVVSLREIAKGVKNSNVIVELLQKIDDIDEITNDYVREKREASKQLDMDKQNILKKIRTLRQDINEHLDKLESDVLENVTTFHNEHSKNIKDLMEQSANMKTIVDNCKRLLNTILKCSSDVNVFLQKDPINRKVREQEEIVSAMISNPNRMRLEITLTPELANLTSSTQFLGTIKAVQVSPVQQNVGAFRNLPGDSETSKRDYKAQAITTFQTSKCDTRYSHGVELLSDGRILLTDFYSNTLCLFDSKGKLQKEVTLPGDPRDVTMISDNEAAVSYFSPVGICIVDIDTNNIIQQNIMKNHNNDVYGISSLGDHLVLAWYDRIVIMDRKGVVLNNIKTSSYCDSRYVTAVSNTRLCYTNYNNNTVICIDMDGTKVFTYKHDKLKYPRGVTSDNEGIIYVAEQESSNVHQISPDGQLIQILLSEDNGIKSPYAIHFDRKNNKLVLTHSGSKVTTYKMMKSN